MSPEKHIYLFFTYRMSIEKWKEVGIFSREMALYEELTRFGYKFTFITWDNKPVNLSNKNIKVISSQHLSPFFSNFLGGLFLPFVLRNEIRNADIFKTNQMWGSWVAVVAKYSFKKKLYLRIGYEHLQFHIHKRSSFYKRIFSYIISSIAYKTSDVISVTSSDMANFVNKVFKVNKKKIFVHSNYIDTKIFSPNQREIKINRVLYVGRLTAQKNLHNLVRACHKANLGLDIYGEGEDSKSLLELINNLKADSTINDPIPNEDLPKLINKYMFFALCSHYEGNPKTLLEAMACGSLIICTKSPGIANLVKHGVNAAVSPTTGLHDITNTLKFLTQHNNLHANLSKHARNYIEEKATLASLTRFEIERFEQLKT